MTGATPSTGPACGRSSFVAGRDLSVGKYYRCIATGTGEVRDGEEYLLVTNINDKKGNRQLVNTGNGEVSFASPGSIWST